MGLIRIRETGEVVTEITFRTMHKKTRPTLEPTLTKERLDGLGADPVMESAQADTTPPYEFSFRSGVEQDSNGNWMTVNSVGPVFTEFTDDDGKVQTVDAQTTAYRARVDAERAEVQRSYRTTLLAESDWTQMADTALSTEKKAEWVTYRKALRDLPTASGWPHTHTMPTKPS
jgi:hypothetical protein|tara:strand:+ start:1178 stop:1696 length:519 start_codon:yes stop_codon:yes gene_type:complete